MYFLTEIRARDFGADIASAQGRFKVRTAYLKSKVTEQLTRIPYTFDDQARFKILSKEEMRRKGITSPDIVDTFAFIFLSGVGYTSADESMAIDPEIYNHGDSATPVTATTADNVDDVAALMS